MCPITQERLIISQEDVLDDFNSSLKQLREEFHKTGRYDDANVKLDEIIKLLLIKYFDAINNTNYFNPLALEKIAHKEFGNKNNIAKALQYVFSRIASNKIFYNLDGSNIFGSNPHLNIQSVDDDFATKIVNIFSRITLNNGGNKKIKFDILNESFGHFVRDSFRNHKEDAQYMTPVEVVNAMIDMAIYDILRDPVTKANLFSSNEDSLYVIDPTCGVGTFLTSASDHLSDLIRNSIRHNNEAIIKIRNNNSFIGQDKVDRMARMSKINCLFANLNPNLITQGNSIIGHSFIDKYIGKVDLILTNPPFGAEFNIDTLLDGSEKYEIIGQIKDSFTTTKTINSELIILDRSLKLLKPGGRLVIIVPDAVVSALGIYEMYRDYLSKHYLLKAVIDLPAVTFAQAGTRTKCSILYIQKPYTNANIKHNGVFMAVVEDIGYEVKEKMGSPTKYYTGKNDLVEITNAYKNLSNHKNTQIVLEKPSVVICPFESLINGKWNANFYKTDRIKALNRFGELNTKEIEIKSLKEIAELCSRQRKKKQVSDTTKCISILHINDDSTIRFDEVNAYKPTCPGIECLPGDILFSKINPRIPRVTVVPISKQIDLICSSEFAILKPFDNKYVYLLKTILLTDIVQKQIKSLTSGTSSSHNRIKDSELMNIYIPWPKAGSEIEKKLLNHIKAIELAEKEIYNSNFLIKDTFGKIESLLGI